MAYALMGGIIVGTLLTLVFLPALYVAWFGIEAPSSPDGGRTASEEKGIERGSGASLSREL